MRLLTSESTENVAEKTQVTEKVEHEHKHTTDGPIGICMEKMESGELLEDAAQEALGDFAKAFQTFQDRVGG